MVVGVAEYFKGRTVLITGASGFMGKVLVEKLLRSCPDVEKIYALLRRPRTGTLDDKMAKLRSSQVFDRLKAENPGALESKFLAIHGDLMKIGLDLSPEDRLNIVHDVTVIVHAGATIKFNEFLHKATLLNVRGTREVCELVQEIRTNHPEAVFVHISTAFSQIDKPVVEEQMYPAPVDWRTLIHYAENVDDKDSDILQDKLIEGYPNTYTFTKALTEHVVNDLCGQGGRTAIMRPSIVISALNEPFPGWTDSFNGPAGMLIAGGTGFSRISYVADVTCDFIPVDCAVKYWITAAWYMGTMSSSPQDGAHVHNCTMGKYSTVSNQKVIEMGMALVSDHPFEKMIWFPGDAHTPCFGMYYTLVMLLHMLPALIVDTLARAFGKMLPKKMVDIHRFIYTSTIGYFYFNSHNWLFQNDKLFQIEYKLGEDDFQQFRTHVDNFDNEAYYRNGLIGSQKFLLQQDTSNWDQPKKRFRRFYYAHQTVKLILAIVLFWAVFVKYNVLERVLMSK